MKGVSYYVLFNVIIQRRIGAKTRTMVDLQKPGLCEIVQVYVEAKNLEAERILQILRFGGSVKVVHLMNSSKQCLDADLLDFRPHFLGGEHFIFGGTRGIDVLEYRRETSFVANIVS